MTFSPSPIVLQTLRQEYGQHIVSTDNPETFRLVEGSPLGTLPIVAKLGDTRRPKRQAPPRFYCAACKRHEQFWDGGCYLCADGTARLIGNDCEKEKRVRGQQVAADRAYNIDQNRETYARLSGRLKAVMPAFVRAFKAPAAQATDACLRDVDAEIERFSQCMPALYQVAMRAADENGALRIEIAERTGAMAEDLGSAVYRTVFRAEIHGTAILRGGRQVLKWRRLLSNFADVEGVFVSLEHSSYSDDASQDQFEDVVTRLSTLARQVRSVIDGIAAALDFLSPRSLSTLAAYASHEHRPAAFLRGEYRWTGSALEFVDDNYSEHRIRRPSSLRPFVVQSLENVEAVCSDFKRFRGGGSG